MDKGEESSSSHQVHPDQVVHAPVTPTKPGQPDPSTICKNLLENSFNETNFEEISSKTSFSCWDGNFGSTSQTDDLEIWNRISCRDLLALADSTIGNGSTTQQNVGLNLHNYLTDQNLPTQTGSSLQFTPMTPDQGKKTDLTNSNEDGRTDLNPNLDEQSQAGVSVSTVVEGNQDVEKELTEQTDLNETPQPKQRRRKHRPKVVKEGKRKRQKAPTTPKPDGSTGKRKYVRRKGVEKSTETPVLEEVNGTVDQGTNQKTKKTCKRKINFDEVEKQTEVTVENGEKTVTIEVEKCQKVVESGTPSPITPSKTELPQGRSKKKTKAKCQLNFSQETSPNESNCSTSTCFSKAEFASNKEGTKLLHENTTGTYRDNMESYLSMFTDYSHYTAASIQAMQLQSIFNKKRIENNQSVMTAGTSASSKAPEMPTYNQNSRKKKTNGLNMHDSVLFGGKIDGRRKQQTYMEARSSNFQISIATNKKIKKNSMGSSLYHDHQYFANHIVGNPNFRYQTIYNVDALINQFGRLNINNQMVDKNQEAVIRYMSAYHNNNALVLYQQNRSLVPYEGLFSPMKRRKPRPKVNLDDETSRVWRLLLEDINSQGIDGTDEAKEKWWEEERRVFRGRADSFIARMHLIQGDRRFSRWKGSVLDSVVGVFLTQNVSDHLSSSAFMSLASRYPLKSNNISQPLDEDIPIMSIKQPLPYQVDLSGDDDSCEVVNSNEISKNSTSGSVDLNENTESEKNLKTNQREVEDIISSQNSTNTSQSSVANTTSFVELLHRQGPKKIQETEVIENMIESFSDEESELSAESASQTTVEMVKPQESGKSCNNVVEVSGETVHKAVESNLNDNGTSSTSKVNKVKTGKKQIEVDWDKLRLEAEAKQKREKTPNCMDSLDYEAVRTADVDQVADAIKERGMNNVLAGRIKALLDRLVKDHGSIDLEWLRDVPPDKAKEYLLSFRGLGLKSVECIRLLTLHHLAFPVDTNVGRIAVRLGWVPLQPLPESLQLHLLELYPILESIQQYLWPRLCKLDQRTLYELHYQMITFGKVFCTKTRPNCNACPLKGECRHFASAFASARLGLPAPEESNKSIATLTVSRNGQGQNQSQSESQAPVQMIGLPSTSQQPQQPQQLSEIQNHNPIIEQPTTPAAPIIEEPKSPEPIIEVPKSPEPEQIQQEILDMEDFCEENEDIPMIKLNMEQFTQNLQTFMERHMEIGEGDVSKALVALTTEAASIPTPKLKNVSQLRTEHQVYELPDNHPLLEGLDTREPDDPCSYLLAIWTPGETADSIQPPEGQCSSQESGTLCNEETCFYCNSTREANSQTIRGTLLIPCRTANRGSFPLNGTYFQVNEVFADHESSLNPIDVPRSWLWNLPRRTVYFGTSIPTIFKGLTTEDIQYCFWRGFVCVRGFDQKTRAPRPLMARLHFPASRLKRTQTQAKTDEKEKLKQ